jgi:Nif-specific regulatory protein
MDSGEDVGLLEQLAAFSESAGEYSSAMEYYEQIYRIAERARESSDLLALVLSKMARCHSQTGDYAKALELLNTALENLSPKSSDLDRCRIQNDRAFALIRLGDYSSAEECLRGVTEAILDPAAAEELARAQKSFGIIAMWKGDWETAAHSFDAALAGFRLIGDRTGQAQCLNNMGLMEKNRGNAERGIQHLQAALKCHEDLGDTPHAGGTLNNLGLLEFKVGQWEAAREHWEHALRLQESIANKWEVAKISLNLGNYYRYKRDWQEATVLYARAETIIRDLGEARELVLVKEFQGDLAFASESYDEARSLYRESLAGGEALAPKGDLVLESLRRLADLESRCARLHEAREFVERGLALSRETNEDFEKGVLLRIRARILAAEGDIAAAAGAYSESMQCHERWGSPFELAVTRTEYASFCIESIVDLEDAGRQLEMARRVFESMGADYEAGHAYLLSAKLEMVCDHPSGDAMQLLEAAMDLLDRVGTGGDHEAVQVVHRDIDRLLAETSLSERNDLAALNAAVARVTSAADTPARVRAIERALEERLNAARGALLLVDARGEGFVNAPGSALPTGEVKSILAVVNALGGSSKLGKTPLISTSPARDPRFANLSKSSLAELGSVLFMPLFSDEELLGGLYVARRASAGYLHQRELDFVAAFATTAAMAVQEMRFESIRSENQRLRRQLASRAGFEGIITQSRKMLEIVELVERLRSSKATVLLQGETGTGKELLARAIHAVSSRRERPLVTVNCAALARDVLESELFGHVRGAFTDAKQDKIGLFEKADGATIFLDEIDKTSREFQERLLRVVDEGEIKPVGSSQVRKIDVRILCAANQPLKAMVDAGGFLKDLYYRLRVISIELPPLRERKEDVPLLAEHFLEHFAALAGKKTRGFTHDAMNRLVAHSWPGNVRDLEHEVERAVTMVEDDRMIELENLSPELQSFPRPRAVTLANDESLQDLVESIERDLVTRALTKTKGNRSHAAKLLGISRRGLLNKIARYEINL